MLNTKYDGLKRLFIEVEFEFYETDFIFFRFLFGSCRQLDVNGLWQPGCRFAGAYDS